jgi:glycosyltransferase EpsD
MRRVLFCATVLSHIMAFHRPYLTFFKQLGFEVHVAAQNDLDQGDCDISCLDVLHEIDACRSPFKLDNLRALRQLSEIIDRNDYELIHCHTPVVGALARLAAVHARRRGVKVMYTAHGFHFYKGGALTGWFFYYPVERALSRITDCLVTINQEDYNLARSKNFKAQSIIYVPGVGVDLTRFSKADAEQVSNLRAEYGYRNEDFLLFYAAELNKNKHQDLLLKSLAEVAKNTSSIRLLLAGKGPLMDKYKRLAEQLKVDHLVDFLGHRNDVFRILPMCDVVAASSYREGLPVNIMEAMACAKPIVATKNRGHTELVIHGQNGFLVDPDDYLSLAESVLRLYENPDLRQMMGNKSREFVSRFSLSNVYPQLTRLYEKVLEVD